MYLVILPAITPMAIAIGMLFFRRQAAQKWINLAGNLVSLVIAIGLLAKVQRTGILVLQAGNWPAPFGITLVADLLAAIMVLVTAVIAFTTALYSIATIDSGREKYFYYPLLQILLMGINGAFLTGDIFNLYVWFEVMLIASFVLLALGGQREQLEGAIKYVTLNLLSSAIFLAAAGITYGIVGSLNMADLAQKLPLVANQNLVTVVAMLYLVAFGIKAAIFPLFFWLPASYHTPPVAVSAIFAGLLTKVGVYALIRVFTLIFTQNFAFTHGILLVLAGFTMLVGVLGTAAQMEFRKILSFHIVSQIGYMIMGLALFSSLAVAGAIFYIFHNIVVKTNLFYVSGVVYQMKGSYRLKLLGGLYRPYPLLGLLFLIPALSLAGIPPLSGFWAKFTVIKAGLELQQYVIVGVALLTGLLTLFSMTKVWNEVFWKDEPQKDDQPKINHFQESGIRQKVLLLMPIILLAILTLIIGFNPEPFFRITADAAAQLLNPSLYITTVLGARP